MPGQAVDFDGAQRGDGSQQIAVGDLRTRHHRRAVCVEELPAEGFDAQRFRAAVHQPKCCFEAFVKVGSAAFDGCSTLGELSQTGRAVGLGIQRVAAGQDAALLREEQEQQPVDDSEHLAVEVPGDSGVRETGAQPGVAAYRRSGQGFDGFADLGVQRFADGHTGRPGSAVERFQQRDAVGVGGQEPGHMGEPDQATEIREAARPEQHVEVDRDVSLGSRMMEIAHKAQLAAVSDDPPHLRREVEELLQVVVRGVPAGSGPGVEALIVPRGGFDVDRRRCGVAPAEVAHRECPVVDRARPRPRLLEHRAPSQEPQQRQHPFLSKRGAVHVWDLRSEAVVTVAEMPEALLEPIVEIADTRAVEVSEGSGGEFEPTPRFVEFCDDAGCQQPA